MIVVVGLGNIGLAIARRLALRGQSVIGVELVGNRREVWHALTGREAVADLSDVDWPRVDRVFIVVRMTDQAGDVLGKLEPPAGREIVAHVVTTLEFGFAAQLGRFSRPGLRVIEQPVSGGELGALGGNLTILTAGDCTEADEDFLRSTIAKEIVRFDMFGEPTRAKLLNNITGAYNARALATMLMMAADQGLDPRKFYRVLLTASGGSWMANGFLELLDETLAKDVHMLRDELGGLPAIALDSDADLVRGLAEARALLTGA